MFSHSKKGGKVPRFFNFKTTFLVPEKGFINVFWLSKNFFEERQKSLKINIFDIFYFNYFRTLWTGRVNKFFFYCRLYK